VANNVFLVRIIIWILIWEIRENDKEIKRELGVRNFLMEGLICIMKFQKCLVWLVYGYTVGCN